MAHLVGGALLALPFVAIFWLSWHEVGLVQTLATFAAAGVLLACVFAGVLLLSQ
jgi:hypothetical protein